MSVPLVPSLVTDEDYLKVEGPWVTSDSEWQESGKWSLIHGEADLSFVDNAWAALRPLVEAGTLLGLKVSTAAKREEGSVVICYTRSGKEEARRSAGAIRKAVDFPRMMYYKLNRQTDAGVALRYGDKMFCVYAHTYSGNFYCRDSCNIWILDRGDEHISVPSSWRFQRNPRSDERPSKVNKQCLRKGSEKGPTWYLYCLLTTSRDQPLPEADRVWAVAERLYKEGAVKGISCVKTGNRAEIRLYVAREEDTLPGLQICDRIFDEATTGRFLYYHTGEKADADRLDVQTGYPKPQHTWMYTCDRELYHQMSFVMRNKKPPAL